MPILRSQNKIVLYSHIPKCGGTSIERYCYSIGLKVAFLDGNFFVKSSTKRWSINSPQHIDGESLKRLFPEDFFDACFTVVRHPIPRLKSAFLYQKYRARNRDIKSNLSEFVKNELQQNALSRGYFDNHFLPQTKFLAKGYQYKIFKLEFGLTKVKKYIDSNVLGANTNIQIGHKNKAKNSPNYQESETHLDDEAKSIVLDIYKDDFLKLKYPTS